MIHPETHAVTPDHGPRPAGKPDQCFYCSTPLGGTHATDCVMRNRTVVLEVKTEIVVGVPESWDEGDIDFHRNESSWCADNVIDELNAIAEGACLCASTEIEYVREATVEDESRWNLVFIEREPPSNPTPEQRAETILDAIQPSGCPCEACGGGNHKTPEEIREIIAQAIRDAERDAIAYEHKWRNSTDNNPSGKEAG